MEYSGEIELGFSGALRDAATVVVDDPIFGRYAYGGTIAQRGGLTEVVPHDGLRERLHILTGSHRLHLVLDRDAFAEGKPISFDEGLAHVRLTLENHATFAHSIALALTGLPYGGYLLIVDGKRQPEQPPSRRCSHPPGSHLRQPGRGRGDSHREVAHQDIAAARGLRLFVWNEALMGTDLQQNYAMARHGRNEPVSLHRYGFMLPEVPHLGFFAGQVGRQVAPCKSRLSGSITSVE